MATPIAEEISITRNAIEFHTSEGNAEIVSELKNELRELIELNKNTQKQEAFFNV